MYVQDCICMHELRTIPRCESQPANAQMLTYTSDALRHQPARRLQIPYEQYLYVGSSLSPSTTKQSDHGVVSSEKPRSRTSALN